MQTLLGVSRNAKLNLRSHSCTHTEQNTRILFLEVREWSTDPHMHEVMFGQKEGWYTRIAGNYEVHDESHPVAYVGRAGHGFYHDSGGSNTCCYYEDTRNPGKGAVSATMDDVSLCLLKSVRVFLFSLSFTDS